MMMMLLQFLTIVYYFILCLFAACTLYCHLLSYCSVTHLSYFQFYENFIPVVVCMVAIIITFSLSFLHVVSPFLQLIDSLHTHSSAGEPCGAKCDGVSMCRDSGCHHHIQQGLHSLGWMGPCCGRGEYITYSMDRQTRGWMVWWCEQLNG